ncbi:MAG: site-specific DNA-methyltransferase, partial [Alphaproteobacteria bacterium]|nr:site-specific DNA-methyltransferase [Alphaproteobacteria bacterium]
MKWQLHNTDAIPWLMDQASEDFEAVVTDPPYSSGGLHTGARTTDSANGKYLNNPLKYPEFSGENRDQFSYMQWSTLWMTHAYRLLRVGAPILVFSDWRQLPVLSACIQAAGFTWR